MNEYKVILPRQDGTWTEKKVVADYYYVDERDNLQFMRRGDRQHTMVATYHADNWTGVELVEVEKEPT